MFIALRVSLILVPLNRESLEIYVYIYTLTHESQVYIYLCWLLSHVRLLVTHKLEPSNLLCPWNFPARIWSGLRFLTPGNLPDPGRSPGVSCIARRFFATAPPFKHECVLTSLILIQSVPQDLFWTSFCYL